ncbi:MAG: hypothetical protein HYZ27_07380, partial [Deltaproteobacteria bacterium]|nr:hypothetical protein [Deltaproteobacteria bacterium]
RLEVETPDGDKKIVIGVVSAIKDVSSGTKHNLKAALEWFKAEGVEWLVANGDLALEEFDLEEVIDLLAEPALPTLLVIGNSESTGSFARTLKDRVEKHPHLINGVLVRQILADDAELWTVPGYHDRRFVHQNAGCVYKEEDIEALASLTPAGDRPLVLVAHGPPRGKGKTANDWIFDKQNVGDPMLNDLIKRKKIPFGLFGHILEAGGIGVGSDFSTRLSAGKTVGALHVNAGSLSGDPWQMNDGSTGTGMAMLVTIEGGKAKYAVKRFTPPTEE